MYIYEIWKTNEFQLIWLYVLYIVLICHFSRNYGLYVNELWQKTLNLLGIISPNNEIHDTGFDPIPGKHTCNLWNHLIPKLLRLSQWLILHEKHTTVA